MVTKPSYTVMGCTGARPAAARSLRQAIKYARACARKGAVPVNVLRNEPSRSAWTAPTGTSTIVYRCTKRGCGATYSPNASSFAAWERQQRAGGLLGRKSRRRRRRS